MASILVIDDEADVCDILQTLLEGAGHTVRTTTTATNLPALIPPQPDVVLLDVLMPGVNGLECLPEIRALAPSAHILVITGVNDYRLADLFYEGGAQGFLTKPIRNDDLLRTLNRVLEQPPVPPDASGPHLDY